MLNIWRRGTYKYYYFKKHFETCFNKDVSILLGSSILSYTVELFLDRNFNLYIGIFNKVV